MVDNRRDPSGPGASQDPDEEKRNPTPQDAPHEGNVPVTGEEDVAAAKDDDENIDSEDIPVTGNDYVVPGTARIDEIEMSDLVDLSDTEDMEAFADTLDPNYIPDLVDSDAGEMAKYTNDPDILDELSDRQALPTGTERLLGELKEHTSESPDLSAEDVDADWPSDRESGEESAGGSVATPEQNVTGELGEALGIEYNDFEPLHTEDKIDERDVNRWELNPASADDSETMVDYDKEKYKDEDDVDYGRVDQAFSRLMNDEAEDYRDVEDDREIEDKDEEE